tara:strand:- start:814 stop:972 length:159 start_codon:yes stop_codon:yes gene_type:complete
MLTMPPEYYAYAFRIVLIISCLVGAVSLGIIFNFDERFADFLDKMFDISDDS